jgi:hypothetical protein
MARCKLSQAWAPRTVVRAYRRGPGDVEPAGEPIGEAVADDDGLATFEGLEPGEAIFAVGETPQFGELAVEATAEPWVERTVTIREEPRAPVVSEPLVLARDVEGADGS